MPRPIENYQDFCKALQAVVNRRGRSFDLIATAHRIPADDGQGHVNSYSIWHQSEAGSFWPPECVIAQEYFSNNVGSWMPPAFAASAIGLTEGQHREIEAAVHEDEDHLPWLRRRLLEACGLEEIPHSERRKCVKWQRKARTPVTVGR